MVVVPPTSPETTPPEVIVPTAVLLLVHAPPPGVDPNVVVPPVHALRDPVIAVGVVFTVTIVVVDTTPQGVVTV